MPLNRLIKNIILKKDYKEWQHWHSFCECAPLLLRHNRTLQFRKFFIVWALVINYENAAFKHKKYGLREIIATEWVLHLNIYKIVHIHTYTHNRININHIHDTVIILLSPFPYEPVQQSSLQRQATFYGLFFISSSISSFPASNASEVTWSLNWQHST